MRARATPKIRRHMTGKVLVIASGLAAAAALAGFLFWFFSCPCERVPGGYLLGEVVEEEVMDWSFANEVPLCQVQIRAGILPHSINLNCMSDTTGELYFSCSSCDGKRWSSAVLSEPAGRLKLNDKVYPVFINRVTDERQLDRAWVARITKLGAPSDAPRPDHWWSFQVTSRES